MRYNVQAYAQITGIAEYTEYADFELKFKHFQGAIPQNSYWEKAGSQIVHN